MNRSTAAFLLALLLSGAANCADEIPAEKRKEVVADIKKRMESATGRLAKIAAMRSAIEHAKAGVIDRKVKEVTIPAAPSKTDPVRFPNPNAKAQYIADAATTLKRWESIDDPPPTAQPIEFLHKHKDYKVGECGSLSAEKVVVAAVLDKGSALIATRRTGEINEPVTLLITGIDASKMADGLTIDSPPGAFYVLGTKKIGGKTHLHLTPFALTPDEAKQLAPPKKDDR